MRQIIWRNRAQSEFDRLPRQDRDRILTALERFAETGHGDIQKLRGAQSAWRLRVGDWRIRFDFTDRGNTIRVLRVLRRSQAYR